MGEENQGLAGKFYLHKWPTYGCHVHILKNEAWGWKPAKFSRYQEEWWMNGTWRLPEISLGEVHTGGGGESMADTVSLMAPTQEKLREFLLKCPSQGTLETETMKKTIECWATKHRIEPKYVGAAQVSGPWAREGYQHQAGGLKYTHGDYRQI